MNNSSFDSTYRHKILKIGYSNLPLALQMYEEYLEIYYEDYLSYANYLILLITSGRFEDANNIIDMLEIFLGKDYDIYNMKNGWKKNIKSIILFNKLRLLIYTHKYQEALDFIDINKDKLIRIVKFGLSKIKLYCKKQLGILNNINEDVSGYFYNQILDCSEDNFKEKAKEYIGKEDFSKIIFYSEFLFDEVIREVKKYINHCSKLHPDYFTDEIYFKYSSCGKDGNINADYVKVQTFHDTSDILTIHPVKHTRGITYVNLDYLKQEDESEYVKTRKISQIEKFNRRYNI